MTILFVDHHDSFVNNLIAWFQKHSAYKVVVLQHTELHTVNLKSIRAVIFSPGPGHPSEYSSSIDFYKKIPTSTPFLGVCLGYQILLYAYGAKIAQIATKPIHGEQVQIQGKIKSQFLPHDVLQGYFVRYNSLGIEKSEPIFKGCFTLLAAQGNFSLAAEHVLYPHLGVQFHPESFASPGGPYFMRSFLRLLEC